MALEYWKPRKSEKAKGYFVVQDRKSKDDFVRKYGSVFYAKESDAIRQCEIRNELIEEVIERNRKERRYKNNGKVRRPKIP